MSKEINEAYLTLHHAVQFVAAAGKSYLPERMDDSHTNLQWVFGREQIAGEWIQTPNSQLRFAVDLDDFSLQINNYNETNKVSLDLQGKSIQSVTDWIKFVLKDLGLKPENYSPAMHYSIPEHPVQKGEPFSITGEMITRLTSYFSTAYGLLKELAGHYPQSSEIRIWPHHFDIAVLIPLEFDASGKLTRSIGVGLAAPDSYYDEPYYYVNHWPQPELNVNDLPALKGGGKWHDKDWKGAVLKTSELHQTKLENQVRRGSEFLNHAVIQLKNL